MNHQEVLEQINRACELAEMVNDFSFNIELRPKELRCLIDENAQLKELLSRARNALSFFYLQTYTGEACWDEMAEAKQQAKVILDDINAKLY